MYEFTPADPTIKRPGHDSRLTDKYKILFIYIPLVGFASIMLDVLAVEKEFTGVANVVLGIVLNVLGFMWAKIDADERGYELSRYFPFAVVIFGVFAIVYFLFRSRGVRAGLISTGWLIFYAVAMALALGVISVIITIVLIVVGVLPQNVLNR